MPPENKIVLEAETCAICMDEFNKQKRKPILCLYCDTQICRHCVQTFLLSNDAIEAKCPGCNAAWNQEFLINNLASTFRLKELKTHREKILLDRERARLPESQIYAETYKYATEAIKPIEENIKKLQTEYNSSEAYKKLVSAQTEYDINERNYSIEYSKWFHLPEIKEAREKRDSILRRNATINYQYMYDFNRRNEPIPTLEKVPSMPPYSPELKKCTELRSILATDILKYKKDLRGLRKEIDNCINLINPYKYTITHYGLTREGTSPKKSNEHRFIYKCPASNCAGFLNSSWECGLCSTKTCKHCREVILDVDSHLCNPETVETVKAISKDTKPCPKCGTLISKISGCDQMWCIHCKTAFSWNTGRIETTVIHNPHYFQWMRDSGKTIPRRDAPGDACNIEYRLDSLFRSKRTHPIMKRFSDIEMNRRHNVQLITYFNTHLREYESDEWRRQLRVKRLLNEITDDEWKIKLQRKEKAYHKVRAQAQLVEMYTNVCRDIIAQILENDTEDDLTRIMNQWKELKHFVDESIERINKSYGCITPEIFNTGGLRNWETW